MARSCSPASWKARACRNQNAVGISRPCSFGYCDNALERKDGRPVVAFLTLTLGLDQQAIHLDLGREFSTVGDGRKKYRNHQCEGDADDPADSSVTTHASSRLSASSIADRLVGRNESGSRGSLGKAPARIWDSCERECRSDGNRTLLAVTISKPFWDTVRHLNCPESAGSRYVGGADADLCLDHRLVEVKTTIDSRRDLLPASRQLLGYVLLDWSDEHAMEEAGLYFARQGKQMSWPLGRLIAGTTGDSNATLKGLRLEFEQLAEEARAQRRRRGSRSEA